MLPDSTPDTMSTLNYAHRGARSLAPENTLPAIRRAWELGADGVEVDVQATADGRLVLFHDRTPDRTTDRAECYPDRAGQPLASFTLAELRQLDAGSWYLDTDPFGLISAGQVSLAALAQFQAARIPTLEELLAEAAPRRRRLNLELKRPSPPLADYPLAEQTLAHLEQMGDFRSLISISSFVHRYLEVVVARAPDLEVNALIGADRAQGNDWGDFRWPVYNANADFITREQLLEARRRGCRVNLYTVNHPEEMRRFASWEVAGIITDYPQLLAEMLR